MREVIPTGFIRLIEDGSEICDLPIEQMDRLISNESLVWDLDHYELTPKGRDYVRSRLLN